MGLLRRLIRPPVLLATGGVLMSATSVVVVRIFGLSLLIAILVVFTVVLIAVILVLLRKLKSARAAEAIELTISRQAERDVERSIPGQMAEMEGMKAELLAAIESLKSSKLGRRGERGALSRIPWYLILGPAGVGKSTLLGSAGLHLPGSGRDRAARGVRGIGGTRSFDWWITEEALFLDMAGRTLSPAYQFEDNEDWLSFLEVLRKQRGGSPFNGVLVAVGVDQVADRPEAELDALASRVRDRVREIVHHLGVVLPVYVLFTKCDRLAGFSEFVSGLGPEESRQPWGATIPLEQSRLEDAATLFDAEFDHLLPALSSRCFAHLADIPDHQQRARVLLFPHQLERVRPGMRQFLKVLFEPDPLEEGPTFRGFYLTSAVQEGAPVDRIVRPAAAALGVSPPAPSPVSRTDGGYFLHDLIARVVLPDAHLAAPSSRSMVARGRRRILSFAVLVVVFLVVAIGLFALSRANAPLVAGTRRVALEVTQNVRPEAPLTQNLLALEDLRVQVAALDSLIRRKPAWRRLGGYAGDVLADPSRQLYVEKALEALVAPAVREMEGRLVELTDTRQGEFLPYYTLFRAWRLLTEPTQMTSEDAPLVGDEMVRALAPRLAFASPDDRERFPKLVQTQAAFLIANRDLVARLIPDYYRSRNPELVARGADRLRETWDSSEFYRQLLAEVEPHTKAVDLAALAGPTGLLAGGSPVPGPFTREGWEKHVMPRVQAYRAQMERDWVVAQAFQGRPPDLGRDLLTAYAKDYSDHWVRFLNELTLVPPRDLPEAAQLLKAAAESDSPLLRVMQGVKEQTSLAVDPGIELGAVGRDFVILHEFFDSAASGDPKKRVTSILARFVDKLRGSKGGGEDLLDSSKSPSALYQKLLLAAHEKVSAAAQPGAPVAVMKALMAEGDEATNPLKQVVAWAQLLADGYEGCAAAPAVARLLQLPVTGAKQVVRGGVRSELNTKWTLLVLQPYQRTLAGKYPLAEGGPDVALFDFTEFFRPGGTFWSFYDQELSQYLFEDGTARSPELEEAPFSSELTGCLRRAYEIREAFFAADPSAAGVRFSVRTSPPRIEGPHVNVRWVSFDVGGEFATYSMGAPQWQPMTWPGKDPAAGAALRAHVAGGPPVQGREQRGPWGLFRLLDQSQFGQVDRSTPTGTWRLSAGESRLMVVYEFQPTSARHPFQPGFLRFRLPESL